MSNNEDISIAQRFESVRRRISGAAARAGRSPDEVTLVAVTKTHSAEIIREALDEGHGVFGESRVQEAQQKIPQLPQRLVWHFVGHLQKNKIKPALDLFSYFHGIDTLALARQLNAAAAQAGVFPDVLLQVNVAGESSKFGFSPEVLRREIDELLRLERLQIRGLMTIPPLPAQPEDSRPHFQRLRELRDAIESETGVPLPELSMGMTGDFEIAIEEGATLVRVGTALFGKR